MNILIIGGAGFVGNNLLRDCLLKPDCQITVLDSLDPRYLSSREELLDVQDRFEFVQGDLRDETLLGELVIGRDLIFNLAAQSSHTLSLQDPLTDVKINCEGNIKLLEAVRRTNPKASVVYASTCMVMGKARQRTVDESHPENPLEIYSANKGVAEKYYRIYHEVHGLKTTVLRFVSMFGPHGKASPEFGFINYFIHQAIHDKPICIYGSGNQVRNLLYVEDAVGALWAAATHEKLHGDVYFASSPFYYSVKEVAEAVVRIFGSGKIEYKDWPEVREKVEVSRVIYSSEKIEALCGWRAQVNLETGLRKMKSILDLKKVLI